MTVRSGTVLFLLALVACIAIYDSLALWRGGGRATISSVILAAAYSPPYGALIPLLFGLLLGHLLVPQRAP